MEALRSFLVVRMKTEKIDSSCKSHITVSKDLLSHDASNHIRAIMAPTGAPAPQPLSELCLRWQIFLGISPTPNSCHTHLSWAERACVCVCARGFRRACRCVTECESYTCVSGRAGARASVDGEHILACHTCGSLSKRTLCIEGKTSTSVAAAHPIAPRRACRLPKALPKCAPCHLFCVSLTFCLPYVNVFSPRLPSLHIYSSSCPSFLATVEVTFINGEFMCMTAPKPELCFDHPRRLSVNSCNHQSAKYLPFRAHRPRMRWLGVIYRIRSIHNSADLHLYW